VKRRDLVRRLESAGFALIRSEGKHDIYGRGPARIPVPRHNEIKEPTARAILRKAGLQSP
jgi:mRNA interferase HicA